MTQEDQMQDDRLVRLSDVLALAAQFYSERDLSLPEGPHSLEEALAALPAAPEVGVPRELLESAYGWLYEAMSKEADDVREAIGRLLDAPGREDRP